VRTIEHPDWERDGVVETPTWFGPAGRSLFGWLTSPSDRRVTGAVIICPPVGEEGRTSRRTLRELAASLAKNGVLAFRFDYDGTGDSAGTVNDPEWHDGWLESVREAIALVRASGVSTIALVGMRMGATIAATVVAGMAEAPGALVLWDPCSSGRTFLREQALLHRTMRTVQRPADDDGVETPGYVFGASAAGSLGSLRLQDALTIDAARTPVHVLLRDDRPAPAGIVERMAEAGFEVSQVSGQAELLDVAPLDAAVPREASQKVERILLEAVGSGERREVTLPVRSEASIPTPWGAVTESLVALTERKLFGILTRPDATAGPDRGPAAATTVLFLNVASESHIGPSRLWPALAREWAARGAVAGLRFDLGGIGDSPDIPGRPSDATYVAGAIDDVVEVVSDLSGQAVLMGVCSGAFTALEGSLRTDVAGVIAVNPILDSIDFSLVDRMPAHVDPQRRAIRRLPGPLARFAVEHHRTALSIWHLIQRIVPHAAPMSVIGDVVGRGTNVMLVLAEDDRPPFDINAWWRRRSAALRRGGRYQRVDIPTLDHPVLVAAGRDELVARATEHVLTHYT
jgi:alpha-beta hydrolase superfamily lysophospholipase